MVTPYIGRGPKYFFRYIFDALRVRIGPCRVQVSRRVYKKRGKRSTLCYFRKKGKGWIKITLERLIQASNVYSNIANFTFIKLA